METSTVRTFISDLKQHWQHRPFIWGECDEVIPKKVCPPTSGKALLLSPHPDDPECVAITGRLLARSGCDLHCAIASMGLSGVEDEYARKWQNGHSISLDEIKGDIRQKEQTRAAEMLGLTPDKVVFLCLEEDKDLQSHLNRARLRNYLGSIAPDIVVMPVGKDPNLMHRWVYQFFREFAKDLIKKLDKPIVALYNEDPKTIEIRKDLFVLFGEEDAFWKSALLRAHDSQHQRNIHYRGLGFDERILRMNHLSYKWLYEILPTPVVSANYAEVFEIELFDFHQDLRD